MFARRYQTGKYKQERGSRRPVDSTGHLFSIGGFCCVSLEHLFGLVLFLFRKLPLDS